MKHHPDRNGGNEESSDMTKKINEAYIFILVGMIQSIWPLATTGSFFNNWICSTIFLTAGVYLFVFSNEVKNKI